jgi:NADPH2:quinone reductase
LVIGFTSGQFSQVPTNHALVKNYSVIGVNLGTYAIERPALLETIHDELDRHYLAESIAPLVGAVVPFDEAPDALARLGRRETVGKVVCAIT